MEYLVLKDFKKQIQADNLQQIIGSDSTVLDAGVSTAIEEASSYLIQKYELSTELKDIIPYNAPTLYNAGDRVVLDFPLYTPATSYVPGDCVSQFPAQYYCITATTGPWDASKWALIGNEGDLYFAIYPHKPFSLYQYYAVGDTVFYKNAVFTCRIATTPIGHVGALQYRQTQNLPYPSVYPDDINKGQQYWGTGVPYNVPALTPVTDTAFWMKGDSRSQQLVTFLIDMALYHVHSRISPRNIPELREKRYDDAISWLRKCSKGEVTPKLPVKQPVQGARIRWGGNIKNINSY